jgi:hypothetical protein
LKPEIALARTAPRSGRYERWAPGGGVVSFTPLDAAHALAGANDLGARLLLLKYGCGVPEDKRPIAVELGFRVVTLVEAPKDTRIAGISVMLGVVEELLTPQECFQCGGRGFVKVGDKVDECERCSATGRDPWSPARRAQACGVSRYVMRTTAWRRIYDEALRVLTVEEADALWHMRSKLRN